MSRRKPRPVVSYRTTSTMNRTTGTKWFTVERVTTDADAMPVVWAKDARWAERIAQALTDEEEYV